MQEVQAAARAQEQPVCYAWLMTQLDILRTATYLEIVVCCHSERTFKESILSQRGYCHSERTVIV